MHPQHPQFGILVPRAQRPVTLVIMSPERANLCKDEAEIASLGMLPGPAPSRSRYP